MDPALFRTFAMSIGEFALESRSASPVGMTALGDYCECSRRLEGIASEISPAGG
jgi:hypothetical protein